MAVPKSIGQFGKTEEFFSQVARGQVPGHSIVIRSGLNTHVDSGQMRAVWDSPTLYPFSQVASQLTVSSTSASDTAGGALDGPPRIVLTNSTTISVSYPGGSGNVSWELTERY